MLIVIWVLVQVVASLWVWYRLVKDPDSFLPGQRELPVWCTLMTVWTGVHVLMHVNPWTLLSDTITILLLWSAFYRRHCARSARHPVT